MIKNNFDISPYIKKTKNIVVELDDEVEYIIDNEAVSAIKNDKKIILLIRVIDREIIPIEIEKIINAVLKNNIIDYIDAKNI